MPRALDEAMARQFARYRQARREGMPRAGWKICVNDPVAQHHLGLDGSFVGFLDGRRALASGATYRIPPTTRLAVEAEVALRIGAQVPACAAVDEARRAIAAASPSLELVDYALASRDLARIAETASFHHGFVLGNERSPQSAPRVRADCPSLRINDAVTGPADARLVPEDLAVLVVLVARFLDRFDERLEAGDWILCGSCVRPAFVAAGDEVNADFGPLGVVSATFAEG
ncbi:MAG TPA: fumarylacetoacetate hydrolase family protein [Candidatus Limnocylindrales bacterium]|nr:fumarylacetoacetate hydrolase family protein [Candidatus Limnocylindrales bacterium]